MFELIALATLFDGTATAPGLALTNYPSTGFYECGANQTCMTINGIDKWKWSGNDLIGMNAAGHHIRLDTASGSDTGAFIIGAAGVNTSNRTAVLTLYGREHATWPGELVLTAMTNGLSGYLPRISLESPVQTRRGLVVGDQHSLTPGGYDLKQVPNPDGMLHVFGWSVLNNDPSISGFSAIDGYDTGVFEQKGGNVGITLASESAYSGTIAFGDVADADVGRITYNHADDTLQFWQNGLQRAVVGNAGWLIGKSASNIGIKGAEIQVSGRIQSTTDDAANIMTNRMNTSGTVWTIRLDNVDKGSVSANSTGVQFNTTSDYRLKKNAKAFDGLAMLNQMQPYQYEWKTGGIGYGFYAHELQEVYPQAVTGVKDGKEMQQVDYSKIVPVLVKAVQELSAQVEACK